MCEPVRPAVTDAVIRLRHFEQAHREVKVSVEPGFLAHRAVWIDPATGNEQSVRCLSLSLLLDALDREFGQ